LPYNKFSHARDDVVWEEARFALKPGIDLARMVDAFEEHYGGLNQMAGYVVDKQFHDSGNVAELYAESGGNTIDSVFMLVRGSGGGLYTAWILVIGDTRKSKEAQYEQVRAFFGEAGKTLLDLKSWGVQPESGDSGKLQHSCPKCGTLATSADAVYCWKCGEILPTRLGLPPSSHTVTQLAPPQANDGANSACIICRKGFVNGELLAWCPFCGAAAHRLHLLEFLHVKGQCPSCGHNLEEHDLADQLGEAHLRLPGKPGK
jgi:ribosomal protein S27AE/predicted RNA-binding Zn-ribbon protein involved in translation (DUF1610 family)